MSSTSSSDRTAARRRGLLAALAGLAALPACGFRPLYGPEGEVAADPDMPDALRREMAAVRVGPMYDRFGQLMRRDLQRSFEGLRPGTPARYVLTVAVRFDTDVLGYRRDGTISRMRYVAIADWDLTTQAVPPVRVARSVYPLRAIDAFNIPDLQFFSADVSRDAMEGRLIETLSRQIVQGVALQLRQRLEAGTGAASPA